MMASTRGRLDLHLVLLCPGLFSPADQYGVRLRRSGSDHDRAGRRAAGDGLRELPLPVVQIVGGHLRGSAADGHSRAAVVRGCATVCVGRPSPARRFARMRSAISAARFTACIREIALLPECREMPNRIATPNM